MPEQEMSLEEARRRLKELQDKEGTGELTVHEAGEMTRLLVLIGEKETGEQAA